MLQVKREQKSHTNNGQESHKPNYTKQTMR